MGPIDTSHRFRLRPSVALTPRQERSNIIECEFFLGNTRQQKRFALAPHLYEELKQLDGMQPLSNHTGRLPRSADNADEYSQQFIQLISTLVEACIVEPLTVVEWYNDHPRRRTITFLQDFFPGAEVREAVDTLSNSTAVIFGCGGVGSWVARLLVQSGIKSLVLIDPDAVESSNLNRSLFSEEQIGQLKVRAIANQLYEIDDEVSVETVPEEIGTPELLADVLDRYTDTAASRVLINCADHPNVDTTNHLVATTAMPRKIPHVIAGGYNLHMSLIGPTVIPFETPCLQCIRTQLEELRPQSHEGVRKLSRPKRKVGSVAPLVGTPATFATNEAIRALLVGKRIQPAMAGRRGEINFLTGKVHFTDFERRASCALCG